MRQALSPARGPNQTQEHIHMPKPPTQLDAESIHRKYLEERDKRLRADGDAQFIEAKGVFAEFTKGHGLEEPLPRPAIREELDVLVIGAGFGGMLTAAELRNAGV